MSGSVISDSEVGGKMRSKISDSFDFFFFGSDLREDCRLALLNRYRE